LFDLLVQALPYFYRDFGTVAVRTIAFLVNH
jgi:hypothetical protein